MTNKDPNVSITLIIIMVTASLSALWLVTNVGGHYDDKGYRLCMHAIDPSNDKPQATPEFINACATKYVGQIPALRSGDN